MNYSATYKTLQYMSGEIINNMARIVLKTEPADKYAIKRVVTKDLQIKIALYNTENEKGAIKEFSAIEFCKLCSDVVTMESYFTKLTYDMLEQLDQ